MKFLIILLAVAACSPVIDSRGHVRDVGTMSDVVPNVTTREEVMERYGSPSTVSSFGQETWYYMTAKKEAFAFFKPEIVDQQVMKITFDTNGLVARVDAFDKNAMREIALADKVTPTEGQELTAIEQLLGNAGRFNTPGNTPGRTDISGARGRR